MHAAQGLLAKLAAARLASPAAAMPPAFTDLRPTYSRDATDEGAPAPPGALSAHLGETFTLQLRAPPPPPPPCCAPSRFGALPGELVMGKAVAPCLRHASRHGKGLSIKQRCATWSLIFKL